MTSKDNRITRADELVWNGDMQTCTLAGYWQKGASRCVLPVCHGINRYHVHVDEGRILLQHMARGFDCPVMPLDGSPAVFKLTAGHDYDIGIWADENIGEVDSVTIVNDRLFHQAKFRVSIAD